MVADIGHSRYVAFQMTEDSVLEALFGDSVSGAFGNSDGLPQSASDCQYIVGGRTILYRYDPALSFTA